MKPAMPIFQAVLLCLHLCLHTSTADSLPQTSSSIRSVTSASRLQRAFLDGVRHIVVGAHIAATDLQADPEGIATSVDNAIGDLKATTRSIVGNCSDAAPADWQSLMKEPLPPGACVIRVPEDFIEMTFGVPELWIHNLYMLVDVALDAGEQESSTLILHHDGSLWITQSVFQGRSQGSRAIDMNTKAGGLPLLYVANTTFSDFSRDHGAAIRMLEQSHATLVDVTFKRTEVVTPTNPSSQWVGLAGSSITAVDSAQVWLEDVLLIDQVAFGEANGSMAYSWSSVAGGAVFADPPTLTWDYGTSQVVESRPLTAAGRGFLTTGSVLTSIQEEQAQFAASLEPVATAPDANATVSDNTTAPTPLSAAPTEAPPLTVVDDIPSGSSPTTPNEADEGVAKTSNNNSHIYWLVGSAVVGSLVATVALIVLIGYRRRQRRASGSELKPGADHVHGKGLEAVSSQWPQHPEEYSTLPPLPIPPTWGPGNHPSHFSNGYNGSQPSSVASMHSNVARLHPRDSTTGSGDPGCNSHSSIQPSASIQQLHSSVHSTLPPMFLPDEKMNLWHAHGLQAINNTTTFDVTTRIALAIPASPGDTLDREMLELALDRLGCTRSTFMGQFEMLGPIHRRAGGQGTVQFAQGKRDGSAVAIKFFMNRNAFNVEEALYLREGLRGMMPAITMIENNDSGVAMTEEGWRFPPFIVVERGESLDEWQARIQPDFPTIVQVLSHVTERVKTMHDLGLIHRDLKPGNVLWRPGQHSWTLIDFGCAANIGVNARLTYSLSYSPPETLCAVHHGVETVVADAALDMWAVGVIAYELMTGQAAFPLSDWMKCDIHAAALGKRAYPWESAVGTFRNIPELRALTEPVCACLSRNPTDRPTSEQLLAQLNGLFDQHITSSTTRST